MAIKIQQGSSDRTAVALILSSHSPSRGLVTSSVAFLEMETLGLLSGDLGHYITSSAAGKAEVNAPAWLPGKTTQHSEKCSPRTSVTELQLPHSAASAPRGAQRSAGQGGPRLPTPQSLQPCFCLPPLSIPVGNATSVKHFELRPKLQQNFQLTQQGGRQLAMAQCSQGLCLLASSVPQRHQEPLTHCLRTKASESQEAPAQLVTGRLCTSH